MATIYANDFNAFAQGTVLTPANSGLTSAPGSVVADNTHTVGARAVKLDTTVSDVPATLNLTYTSTVADQTAKWDMFLPSNPTANMTLFSVKSGTTILATVKLLTNGTFAIYDGGAQKQVSGVVMTPLERVHFQWVVSNTNNVQELLIFKGANAGGTIPDDVLAGAYMGGDVGSFLIGIVAGTTPSYVAWVDEVNVTDVYTSPYVSSANRILDEHFENATSGTTIATTNTDFNAVSIGAGSALTFDSAQFISNGQSMKADGGGTGNAAYGALTFTALGVLYVRWYQRIPSIPGSNTQVCVARNGGSLAGGVRINSTGFISILDGASAVDTTSTAITPLSWVRFAWTINAAAGIQTLDWFRGANVHGTSPSGTIGGAASTFTSFATIDAIRVGLPATPPVGFVTHVDDVAIDKSGMPGPTQSTHPTYAYLLTSAGWVVLENPVLL